ncbi:MAG: hypothetical protein B6I32_06605 [Desulfobacterium sp. 4572_20]|nr:MAG: hypothetical protein B6I32_06605 [Desulfobacterium sp. 4572_20]
MDVQSQIPLVDYLIMPDLEGFSPSSFGDGVKIMNRGEAAARTQIDVLRALADSVNSLGQPPQRIELPKNDSILISDIEVLAASPSMTRFFIEKSGLESGTWINPEELNDGIDKLFGTLFFEKIEYYFENMDEGKRLVFRIKEKPVSSIGVALHYDNAFGPGFILNYTHLNSLVEGSRLGLTADISESPQLRGYYDIHLGKKRNSIGSVFVKAEREELPFYSNDVDIGNYHHSFLSTGISLLQTLGTNSHVSAELDYRYSTLKLSRNIKEVRPELEYLDNLIYRGPEMALLFQRNSFDNNLYPTRGSRVDIKYRHAFNTSFISIFDFPDSLDVENRHNEKMDPYWVLTVDMENYLPLGSKVSVNTGIGTGISHNDKPFPDNFYVGDYRYNLRENQVAFVGLHNHELLQGNYLKGKLALQVEIIPNLYLSALGNLIVVSDDNTEFLDDILSWNDDARYIGAGAGFTYKTPIGPVSVYLGSRTDIWNLIWYTSIGFTF